MLTKFLARCIIDEILSPGYLSDPIIINLGNTIVEATIRLLSREHAHSKLEQCWGKLFC
jgi:hypothetical protein